MISIVIPIYNEEENLPQLHKRLTDSAASWQEDYEIVLVDDGSFDRSADILRSLTDSDGHVHVVRFSRNFGHQAAISAGINYAKGDAVVIMDGDLQDPPEELHRFLDKWREGYEVVFAVRTKRKEHFFKRIAYKLFYRILSVISDINIPLDSGDFCVMDRKVVDVLKHEMPEKFRFVRGLRAYAGFRQIGVKYERHSRAAGEVKYTFKKLMALALDGIFNFSTFPLRLATYLGLTLAIPSFLVGIFFIIHRIFDFKVLGYSPSDTPGLATLAVGMFFLFGIVLLILGIMGEYIGRIFYEIKGRPFYVVREVWNRDLPKS
ncbi:MAG: glycosyltransferase family 2 protein [Flavobacteriales bacterium]|nr:glycosyltransferase family 2 protein [Flavobacteriales bacterium]